MTTSPDHYRGANDSIVYPLACAERLDYREMVDLLLEHINLGEKIETRKDDLVNSFVPIAAACGRGAIIQ